jgi:hypothetical protein
MVTHIATAGTEQSATAEHVKERMQQIAVLVNQTANEARNSAQACQGLSELAMDLQKMVANFQLHSDEKVPNYRGLPAGHNQGSHSGNPAKATIRAFRRHRGLNVARRSCSSELLKHFLPAKFRWTNTPSQ